MAQNPKNRSATLSTTVSFALTISTVIVFTVLLILAYENIRLNKYNDSEDNVKRYSELLANQIKVVISDDDEFMNDNYKMKVISDTVQSAGYYAQGCIFVIDKDKNVLYSANNIDDYQFDFSTAVNNPGKAVRVDYKNDDSIIYSVAKVGNTGFFAAYAVIYDKSEVHDEFRSVILYPALIAIVVALVFFLLAIQTSFAPVREMSKVMTKVSEGDLTARVDSRYCGGSDPDSAITTSSDLVVMANTLNDMIEKLENQENDRQIFISSVAHDIRTPLTSINGFVSAMMDGTIPPENYERYMGLIKQEINRIRSLVVSMTEASSLSHVDPDVMERFPVDDVINDIVSNLEPQFKEKDISCEVRLSDDPSAKWCYGEAQQLCRVVQNIITNAIKFTPGSGKILVKTEPSPNERKVYISVEDSGLGIPREKRSRIFESFYKVDSSRTKEGFGLGLYICKQILLGHGQTIIAEEGEELGGAKFLFSFPMPPEDQ